MKNIICSLSLLTFSLNACNSGTEKKTESKDPIMIKSGSKGEISRKEDVKTSEIPKELNELIPVDILDGKSKNVYEKYGIEFSGNCYACDLANLSVTKNKIVWTNVCDEKDTFEINTFTSATEGNTTVIKTAQSTYILTKIDEAPVYKLVTEGEKPNPKNKRLSGYFTTKQALPLFREHDCGDFEG
ncbi:hypothetical protein VUJ46_01465 [Chryseobacterium sp. MYb264]|uniref:hypothetical protein n=1 Tax=Chryseobacterium sp. MYb264 TaxID=2745153 RepID=UPI002E0D8714|nr:hypothetical protein VUJ46_01465 [Chryseobacterium sp. MYb264]